MKDEHFNKNIQGKIVQHCIILQQWCGRVIFVESRVTSSHKPLKSKSSKLFWVTTYWLFCSIIRLSIYPQAQGP